MFDQGDEGICYLVAGINAFNNIPSILDQLFIDKEYSPDKKIYNFNVFINSYLKSQQLNDNFLYYELRNNKLLYRGNQTFKYELFLKFIVKLFAELCKSKVEYNFNETLYAIKKLEYISKGGYASELYACILGTSSSLYRAEEGQNEYINNLEKYINIPGNIIATSAHNEKVGHQYAVKNLIEYSGKNGEKKKFITLFNPWGKGEPEKEKTFFDFNKIQKEVNNFEYVFEFNNNYINSGLIKIPLDLFCKWFKYLEICSPKYGFHYKVLNNNLNENQSHIYCFSNNINQKIEIELFLGELENIRLIQNYIDIDIELNLSKLEDNYNINIIRKVNQKESIFFVRKNAYIFIDLKEGNYLINIKLMNDKNTYDYNLRIGGELEYLNEATSDILEIIEKEYDDNYFNDKIINITDEFIISKYILLEKTYYDLKVMYLAKEIHNIIYNPYENDIEIKVENGLKNIVTTITDAFNNRIYKIKKNYENGKNSIYYFYKNANQIMGLDAYNHLKNHEMELLKIDENLNDESNNVKVILQLSDDSKKKITLKDLINKIKGPELEKQQFYGSIRGYLITQFGIELIKDGQNIESTNFFRDLVIDKIPDILKKKDGKISLDFDLIRNPSKNDIINRNICDVLFMVDATGSMSSYIKSAIQNCSNIIERLNLFYNYEKRFKYGAIFYRDPIDCRDTDKHSFFPMTSNKNEFQNWIKTITAQGGGDLAEDWNGAYELALNQMNWSSGNNNKIVVHIADSSAHGNEFNPPDFLDQHPEEGPKFIKTIEKIANFGLKIIAFPIGDKSSFYSFKKFQEIYKLNNGYSFFLFPTNIMDVEYFNNITEQAIKFIIDYC